jgi:hypothetical protein
VGELQLRPCRACMHACMHIYMHTYMSTHPARHVLTMRPWLACVTTCALQSAQLKSRSSHSIIVYMHLLYPACLNFLIHTLPALPAFMLAACPNFLYIRKVVQSITIGKVVQSIIVLPCFALPAYHSCICNLPYTYTQLHIVLHNVLIHTTPLMLAVAASNCEHQSLIIQLTPGLALSKQNRHTGSLCA